jgi:hypothetical protein
MPDKTVFNVKVIRSREVRRPRDVARTGAVKNYAELLWKYLKVRKHSKI